MGKYYKVVEVICSESVTAKFPLILSKCRNESPIRFDIFIQFRILAVVTSLIILYLCPFNTIRSNFLIDLISKITCRDNESPQTIVVLFALMKPAIAL